MSDCSNHKKDLFGQSDMKVVAEAIGDLHYETLAELLKHLYEKIADDARRDWNGGRNQLWDVLMSARNYIELAQSQILKAWTISKPFMEETKTPQP